MKNNTTKNTHEQYEAPRIELIPMMVENGFGASVTIEGGEEEEDEI